MSYNPHAAPVAMPKPERGASQVATKALKAERKAHERREMEQAKARDRRLRGGCAWPRCEHKRMTLHACHVDQHRGMGGNPSGDRTTQQQLLSFCPPHHGQYDRKDIGYSPQTAQGTDGCCDFNIRVGTTDQGEPIWELYAAERLIGVSTPRDGGK